MSRSLPVKEAESLGHAVESGRKIVVRRNDLMISPRSFELLQHSWQRPEGLGAATENHAMVAITAQRNAP